MIYVRDISGLWYTQFRRVYHYWIRILTIGSFSPRNYLWVLARLWTDCSLFTYLLLLGRWVVFICVYSTGNFHFIPSCPSLVWLTLSLGTLEINNNINEEPVAQDWLTKHVMSFLACSLSRAVHQEHWLPTEKTHLQSKPNCHCPRQGLQNGHK